MRNATDIGVRTFQRGTFDMSQSASALPLQIPSICLWRCVFHVFSLPIFSNLLSILSLISHFCAIYVAITESLDLLYLHETRAPRVIAVQIGLMTLATVAVILIAIQKSICRCSWSLDVILTIVPLV